MICKCYGKRYQIYSSAKNLSWGDRVLSETNHLLCRWVLFKIYFRSSSWLQISRGSTTSLSSKFEGSVRMCNRGKVRHVEHKGNFEMVAWERKKTSTQRHNRWAINFLDRLSTTYYGSAVLVLGASYPPAPRFYLWPTGSFSVSENG